MELEVGKLEFFSTFFGPQPSKWTANRLHFTAALASLA